MNRRFLIALSVTVLSFVAIFGWDAARRHNDRPADAITPEQAVAEDATPLPTRKVHRVHSETTAAQPLYDVAKALSEPYAGGVTRQTVVLSRYDDVIRRVSRREGLDWRLLSAIAYHESRFKPNVVSPHGARGIMQIMPVVARNFNVPLERVVDTETNVTLAAKLLNSIEQTMKLPDDMPSDERMKLVLASYNAGIGNMTKARQRASRYGYDANSWDDVAPLLARRETTAYVRNVMGQYSNYCMMASL